MNQPLKFSAMVIDPDLDARMRLKQATASVHHFGKVLMLADLNEGQARFGGGEIYDLCFITHRLDKTATHEFIKTAKASKGGQDTTFVLVLQNSDQQSSTVAQNVLAGFDGFLFEPYSVDQLLELTRVALEVKKQRASAREEAALKFLLADIVNQVDQIAFLRQSGIDANLSMKKFRDMTAMLKSLSTESVDVYKRLAVEIFEAAPMPKKIFQKKIYGGASTRVKKKQEKTIVAEIQRQAGGEGEAK